MHRHSYSADLTEGTTWGGKFRHGRWTTWLKKAEDGPELAQVSAEWALFWNNHTGMYFTADPSEGSWQVHIGLVGLFSVFVTLQARWLPMPKTEHYESRTLSLNFHDEAIFWEVWKDPHSWSREDRWRNSAFHWKDWLLGKPVYESKVIEHHEGVLVPMPEGAYPTDITLTEDTWTRPRGWGIFDQKMRRANVEPQPTPRYERGHIPHPGKWGDDDGLFGMTTPARSLSEAIGATVESVMRSRQRYGRDVQYPSPNVATQ